MRDYDMPRGGRFSFRSRGVESKELPDIVRERKSRNNKSPLRKNRIYLKTPENWYSYRPDEPRDVTSSYYRNGSMKAMSVSPDSDKRSPQDRLFAQGNNKRNIRKAMIIGEKPSMYKMTEYSRPELPGNLFVDNLRHQKVDWRKYDGVTWNDILGSHVKDVQGQPRSYSQTRPQREAWLASIDDRVRYSKVNSPRGLPSISPRLFNSKVSPTKAPAPTRYVSKDKEGNMFYLVGPSEVTKKEYRPFILPEIVKPAASPSKFLNF